MIRPPPLSRSAPQAQGLSARLTHSSGMPAISITDAPQAVDLTFTNRTALPITAGPATLRLIFRDGVLAKPEQIALAPQSEGQWVLSEADYDAQDQVLVLAGVERFVLAPGQDHTVRMEGITAAAAGGSRATRVEFAFDNLFHPSGEEVQGSRLIHLAILRRHAPQALALRDILHGSRASAGPFTAGFTEQPALLNDAKTPNSRSLSVVNTSGRALVLSDDGDAATRFFIGFQRGAKETPWGLLRAQGDRFTLRNTQPGWELNHHSLRRVAPGVLRPGERLDFGLDIHTGAPSGQTQIVVSFENLPGHDDGDLVLALDLGAMAEVGEAVHMVRPLELRGQEASIQLRSNEEGAGGDLHAPVRIATNRTADHWGRLDIDAPAGMHVAGGLKTDGVIEDRNGPVVPIGTIVMWSDYGGRGIPAGWALCDGGGRPKRPDLRGRFVVGHDPDSGDYKTIGRRAGEATHTLSEKEMPPHAHSGNTGSTGAHYHHVPIYHEGHPIRGADYPPGNGYMLSINVAAFGTSTHEKHAPGGRPTANYGPTTHKTGAHRHSFTTNNTGGHRNATQPHENRPPYYVVAYIIKIA